jgi:hypothetical protein
MPDTKVFGYVNQLNGVRQAKPSTTPGWNQVADYITQSRARVIGAVVKSADKPTPTTFFSF